MLYRSLELRVTQRCWIKGEIKRGENERQEKEVLDFIVTQVRKGMDLKLAIKRSKKKYHLSVEERIMSPKEKSQIAMDKISDDIHIIKIG